MGWTDCRGGTMNANYVIGGFLVLALLLYLLYALLKPEGLQ